MKLIKWMTKKIYEKRTTLNLSQKRQFLVVIIKLMKERKLHLLVYTVVVKVF